MHVYHYFAYEHHYKMVNDPALARDKKMEEFQGAVTHQFQVIKGQIINLQADVAALKKKLDETIVELEAERERNSQKAIDLQRNIDILEVQHKLSSVYLKNQIDAIPIVEPVNFIFQDIFFGCCYK